MPEDNNAHMSLSTIPKLKNNANFAAWKQAVENQLLLAGCIGIVEGFDVEPYRTVVTNRSLRARSAPPMGAEGVALKNEELQEWR